MIGKDATQPKRGGEGQAASFFGCGLLISPLEI